LRAQGGDAPFRRERLGQSDYVCAMRQGHPLAKGTLSLDAYCAAHHLLVSLSGRVVANGKLLTVLPAFLSRRPAFVKNSSPGHCRSGCPACSSTCCGASSHQWLREGLLDAARNAPA
jgi:hypothetical protein